MGGWSVAWAGGNHQEQKMRGQDVETRQEEVTPLAARFRLKAFVTSRDEKLPFLSAPAARDASSDWGGIWGLEGDGLFFSQTAYALGP